MDKIRTYLLMGALLALPSGYGLFRLIMFSLPYLKERYFFFFLCIIFVAGIGLPFFAALNKYFFTAKRIVPKTVVRESLAAAVLCGILFWFRMGRILNSTIVFLAVGGFLTVELILRSRDAVEFRPGIDDVDKKK